MKTKHLVLFSLFALLGAVSAYGQTHKVVANVPFAFVVSGKTLPAGQYSFVEDATLESFRVSGTAKGAVAVVQILSYLSGGIHTTPADSHVVFDRVGDTYYLSEIWIPGMDGYLLHTTKGKHEHRVLNVPR